MSNTMPDFYFGILDGDYIMDSETYPNYFSIGILHHDTEKQWYFEISDRRNDIQSLCDFLLIMSQHNCRMVGYNNIGFDYPVIHFIYNNRQVGITVENIYDKAMGIINSNGPAKFRHMVWESDWIVPQLDLYKIHHFDNMAKATSLKVLEFNMRMDSIEDLPFAPGTILTHDQMDTTASYMWHDIKATKMFYDRTRDQIKMREGLSEKFDKNMTNMSDVKIGETILVSEMGKAGIECFEYIGDKRVKKQTIRDSIDLSEVIFPYVSFERMEFNNILNFLKSKVITETKGVFKGLIADVEGVEYKFGTGGIHASVESQIISSTDTHVIADVDVASFYPNLAIKNKLFPAHLGEQFCDAYLDVYHTRKSYDKKTLENAAFKLALNGSFGGSNNKYSPFFDSKYTMLTTVNGQLLLCMLAEQMLKVPGLKMIQANTDGITYLCPREYLDHTRVVCRWWEDLTQLELEEVLYKRMFIRDVNSYMAEKENGELKRIGAYAHETAEENPWTRELPYHKDWSALVVPKAAEAALVHGKDIREFIENHDDIFDFFLRTKVPRSSSLLWGDEIIQNVSRYYISYDGKKLEKLMPPAGPIGEYKRANQLTDQYYQSILAEVGPGIWDERIHTKNKSVYEERRSGINTGWLVQTANQIDEGLLEDFRIYGLNINQEWYIKEAEKLVKPLLGG